jgi:hypothetical protein
MSREARSESPFVDFAAGSTILHQGEAATALYIIEAGKVTVERSDAPGVLLAELGPGEFFGEMAILQEQPHSANVVAKTAVRALRVDAAAFHAVLRENVEVAVHMMRRLVLRLRGHETRRLELEAQLARSLGMPRSAPVPAAVEAGVQAPKPQPAAAPASASPSTASPAPASPAASAAPSPAGKPVPPATPASAPAAPAAAPGAPAPTPAARRFVLRHSQGEIALPAGKAGCLVGRPDPATGAIPEINLGPLDLARSLSRRHARLDVTADGVTLREEPGVANGTWVNGERVVAGQAVALKAGDKLRFGAIELELGTA